MSNTDQKVNDDSLTDNNLSLFERVKYALSQPTDQLLFRSGPRVTKHDVSSYFDTPEFELFPDIVDIASLCHIAYGEVEGEKNATINFDSLKKLSSRTDSTTVPKGWRQVLWPDANVTSPIEGKNIDGLGYHVWIKASEKKAVIAFRGTRWKKLEDWYANARWVTRFIPGVNDHYAQTNHLIPELVKYLHEQYGEDLTIIAAGHSLGGGLAQHAAYSSPHIKLVYAFAPSFVTGYRSISAAERERNQRGTVIARIFEHGEILAYVRFALRQVVIISLLNPKIVEMRFNCSTSPAVSDHSMGQLADHLSDKLSQEDSRAVGAKGVQSSATVTQFSRNDADRSKSSTGRPASESREPEKS